MKKGLFSSSQGGGVGCREISTYVNTQKKINAAIADPMQSSGQAGICPDVQKGVTEGCYY